MHYKKYNFQIVKIREKLLNDFSQKLQRKKVKEVGKWKQ